MRENLMYLEMIDVELREIEKMNQEGYVDWQQRVSFVSHFIAARQERTKIIIIFVCVCLASKWNSNWENLSR